MKLKLVVTLSVLIGCVACDKEHDIEPRNYPSVITNEVSDITDDGATFYGEILAEGTAPITGYGFVYGAASQPTMEGSTTKVVSFGTTIGREKFSARATECVGAKKVYYRAYAQTSEITAYGNVLSYVPTVTKCPAVGTD